jgi:hypothetical protein
MLAPTRSCQSDTASQPRQLDVQMVEAGEGEYWAEWAESGEGTSMACR